MALFLVPILILRILYPPEPRHRLSEGILETAARTEADAPGAVQPHLGLQLILTACEQENARLKRALEEVAIELDHLRARVHDAINPAPSSSLASDR